MIMIPLRIKEIDGDRYELLGPATSALEGKHPLAAVLLRSALIEVTLLEGHVTRYKHAARLVREIDSLKAQIKTTGFRDAGSVHGAPAKELPS